MAASIAWPYGRLVKIRNSLFDSRILKSQKLACRVISVGNLTVGGTGKTPMVLWLARFLSEEGWRVAIVSRGYRRKHAGRLLVVSDGERILADSYFSGDEPQLVARRLPGLPVLCSSKRVVAVEAAVRQFKSEVVILDDGFQHRYLDRDLDIVMLDAHHPFGNGRLFPRGLLREREVGLDRAQALVLARYDSGLQAQQNREELSQNWPDKPIFPVKQRPVRLFHAVSGKERPVGSLEKMRTAAFAGIAKPKTFFGSLVDLGARLVYASALPDHHPLTDKLLRSLAKDAAGLDPEIWVITEKDWVRLPDVLPENMDLWVLSIELEFGAASSQFRGLVRKSLSEAVDFR